MARFSFRLQALLNWKKNLEEISQMKLAQRRRELHASEEEVNSLIAERVSQDRIWKKKAELGMSGSESLAYGDFAEGGYRQILSKKDEKEAMALLVNAEQEDLLKLMKERKIFERLKARQLKRFSEAQERLDARSQDDMTVMRFEGTKK